MTRHWVVIETGGNQRYIFDTNRMRHVIGASQLVLEVGTRWVREALAGLPDLELVQSISGRALLLARSEQAAHTLIRRVSERALAEAPGLEVTGAVGPAFDDRLPYRRDASAAVGQGLDYLAGLKATQAAQAAARAARPSPLLRDRMLPWHLPCRETGLPATCLEYFGSPEARDATGSPEPARSTDSGWYPAGAAVAAKTLARYRHDTGQRLEKLLGAHGHLEPSIVDDVTEDGRIAVVHADGNAVGRLFLDFPSLVMTHLGTHELSLADYCQHLREFSDALDEATRNAFTTAVAETVGDETPDTMAGQLLPILVGGDDVTFLCHAALALPLTRAFLRAFAAATRDNPSITALATALANAPERVGLTAAAGIAIVKRHHPFSLAYRLAEELVDSAKDAVRAADGSPVSAYDVHIAHESTLRPLNELRRDLAVTDPRGRHIDRHAGPYVVDDSIWPVPEILRPRADRHLRELIELLDDGTLSSSRAHDLRTAIDHGLPEYLARRQVALARIAGENDRDGVPLTEAERQRLEALLEVAETGDLGRRRFLRLVDAQLLHDITRTRPATGPEGTADDGRLAEAKA